MPLHAWDYIVKVQERKIILSVSTKLLKIPSQIRRQRFWEVSSCRLPKVVQNLIIFSKVVPTHELTAMQNLQGCLAHPRIDETYQCCLGIWPPSAEETTMLCNLRYWYSSWRFPACGSTPETGCVLSHNLETQKVWKPYCLTPTTQLSSGHLLL